MMKKKLLIMGLLLATALLLTACSGAPQTQTPTAELPTLNTQAPAMEIPTTVPLPEGIDPSAEEDTDAEYVDPALLNQPAAQGQQAAPAVTEAPSTVFAGATPILLNPIDMPTPTKHPPLVFTYATYTANKLGLSFESVAGYEVEDGAADTYILREPAATVKDNYPVEIVLTLTPVNANYKKTDVRADVRAKLADLGKLNYQKWEPTNTAERSLLKSPGYYADFRGVKVDGTIVRGRVHMALLPDNKLLMLQISHPAEYSNDYMGVHTHMRSTLKTI